LSACLDDVGAVRVELHVPTVFGRTRRGLAGIGRKMGAALGAHHAQSAHAEPGEARELRCVGVLRHQRDAAKAIGKALQRVGQEPVIAAVAAAADDDRTAEPEFVLQHDEGLGQRIARGIGAVGREWIFLGGPEQMDVGVASAARQSELRRLGVRVGCLGENGHSSLVRSPRCGSCRLFGIMIEIGLNRE
jgi:hypothetical protein